MNVTHAIHAYRTTGFSAGVGSHFIIGIQNWLKGLMKWQLWMLFCRVFSLQPSLFLPVAPIGSDTTDSGHATGYKSVAILVLYSYIRDLIFQGIFMVPEKICIYSDWWNVFNFYNTRNAYRCMLFGINWYPEITKLWTTGFSPNFRILRKIGKVTDGSKLWDFCNIGFDI